MKSANPNAPYSKIRRPKANTRSEYKVNTRCEYKLLLAKGADRAATNKDGQTALQVADDDEARARTVHHALCEARLAARAASSA